MIIDCMQNAMYCSRILRHVCASSQLSNIQHCIDGFNVESPIDSIIYSLLPNRQHMVACRIIHCIYNELQNIHYNVQNQQIVSLKYDYWQNELQSSFSAHPIITAVKLVQQQYNITTQSIMQLIHSIQSTSSTIIVDDMNDFNNKFGVVDRQFYSILHHIVSGAHNQSNESPIRSSIELSSTEQSISNALTICNVLAHIPHNVQHNKFHLPYTVAKQFGMLCVVSHCGVL